MSVGLLTLHHTFEICPLFVITFCTAASSRLTWQSEKIGHYQTISRQTDCVAIHLIDPEYLSHLIHVEWSGLIPVLLLRHIINIYWDKGGLSLHSSDQSLDGHLGYRYRIDWAAWPLSHIKKSSLLSSPWKSPPAWPASSPLSSAAQPEMPWR